MFDAKIVYDESRYSKNSNFVKNANKDLIKQMNRDRTKKC